MGIKSLFGFGQARDKPVDKAADAGYSFLFGRTTSGKPVNERTAMQTTAVYACVRILAEAVASLPLHVYEYQDDGGKKLVHDHPLYYLLHDEPNPEMTSFVFRETLMSHLLIWGNAYAQIIRDGAGRVLGLYPLLPDKMDVQRDDRGNIYYVYSRNSDENPMFKEYGDIRLKAEDVLHIPGLGFDGLIGYSPIAMAKNAVGMTLACEEYGASFFANGANPGGVLEHPGVLKDPSKVRESWNSVYRGVNNAHKIAVLEEGMKYQQIGIPPEEAQFLETRKFQINEIARLYRIPPHMVGDLDKSSFSNIEQQSLEFVKYTLDPWVIRWEQSLQRSLLLPGEKGTQGLHLGLLQPGQLADLQDPVPLELLGGGLVLGVTQVQTVRKPLSGQLGDKGAFTDTLGTVQHQHGVKFAAGIQHTLDGGAERFPGDGTDIFVIVRTKVVDE